MLFTITSFYFKVPNQLIVTMISVAENDRYSLKVDKSINRMYITISGFWKSKDGYLEDLDKACKMMKSGFKIHVDLLTIKPMLPEIGEVHEAAQRMLLSYGLAQTAEIQNDRAIVRMALERYSTNSGMKKRVFATHEEAKAWLDQ